MGHNDPSWLCKSFWKRNLVLDHNSLKLGAPRPPLLTEGFTLLHYPIVDNGSECCLDVLLRALVWSWTRKLPIVPFYLPLWLRNNAEVDHPFFNLKWFPCPTLTRTLAKILRSVKLGLFLLKIYECLLQLWVSVIERFYGNFVTFRLFFLLKIRVHLFVCKLVFDCAACF